MLDLLFSLPDNEQEDATAMLLQEQHPSSVWVGVRVRIKARVKGMLGLG